MYKVVKFQLRFYIFLFPFLMLFLVESKFLYLIFKFARVMILT